MALCCSAGFVGARVAIADADVAVAVCYLWIAMQTYCIADGSRQARGEQDSALSGAAAFSQPIVGTVPSPIALTSRRYIDVYCTLSLILFATVLVQRHDYRMYARHEHLLSDWFAFLRHSASMSKLHTGLNGQRSYKQPLHDFQTRVQNLRLAKGYIQHRISGQLPSIGKSGKSTLQQTVASIDSSDERL